MAAAAFTFFPSSLVFFFCVYSRVAPSSEPPCLADDIFAHFHKLGPSKRRFPVHVYAICQEAVKATFFSAPFFKTDGKSICGKLGFGFLRVRRNPTLECCRRRPLPAAPLRCLPLSSCSAELLGSRQKFTLPHDGRLAACLQQRPRLADITASCFIPPRRLRAIASPRLHSRSVQTSVHAV